MSEFEMLVTPNRPFLIKRKSGRWTIKDKKYVVDLVRKYPEHKHYILGVFCISLEEFNVWEKRLIIFKDTKALRTTRLQEYRKTKNV